MRRRQLRSVADEIPRRLRIRHHRLLWRRWQLWRILDKRIRFFHWLPANLDLDLALRRRRRDVRSGLRRARFRQHVSDSACGGKWASADKRHQAGLSQALGQLAVFVEQRSRDLVAAVLLADLLSDVLQHFRYEPNGGLVQPCPARGPGKAVDPRCCWQCLRGSHKPIQHASQQRGVFVSAGLLGLIVPLRCRNRGSHRRRFEGGGYLADLAGSTDSTTSHEPANLAQCVGGAKQRAFVHAGVARSKFLKRLSDGLTDAIGQRLLCGAFHAQRPPYGRTTHGDTLGDIRQDRLEESLAEPAGELTRHIGCVGFAHEANQVLLGDESAIHHGFVDGAGRFGR